MVSFPILNLTDKSFKKSKEVTEMIYLAETTIERLKTKDKSSIEFLENLENEGELEYKHLKDKSYMSIVELKNEDNELWYLNIKVNKRNNKGGREYVEIEATIPK